MLIVLPVSQADFQLAEITANLIAQFGGVRPHGIMLAVSASCPSESRRKLDKVLSQATDHYFSVDLKHNDERGWPRSANTVFAEVAKLVAENNGYGFKSWYFFEADNTPMFPGWADALEAEYITAKVPYMGVKHVTYRGIGPHRREAGIHLVGTAIYPADFYVRSRVLKNLKIIQDPFDVALQWEIAAKAHHTDQILHNWSSQKYIKEKKTGIITCQPARGTGLTNPIPPGHRYAVVHGCKDGSLAKLVAAAHR